MTRDELCYLLDLHLFLGRPFCPVFETPKSDDDIDGLFGIVPQLLLEEEQGQLTSWYTSSIDVVSKIVYMQSKIMVPLVDSFLIYFTYFRLILKGLVRMVIKTILSQDQVHQLIVFAEQKKST